MCIRDSGIPTGMQIEEEDFERPTDGVGVGGAEELEQVLEKVRHESTPTAEKELDFGMGGASAGVGSRGGTAGQANGQNQGQGQAAQSVSATDLERSQLPPMPYPRQDVKESFKEFLLATSKTGSAGANGSDGEGMTSPEEDDDEEEGGEDDVDGDGDAAEADALAIHGLGIRDDMRTPTRATFSLSSS